MSVAASGAGPFDRIAQELWLLRLDALHAYAVSQGGWTEKRAGEIVGLLRRAPAGNASPSAMIGWSKEEKACVSDFVRLCSAYGAEIRKAYGSESAATVLNQYAEWYSLIGGSIPPDTVKFDALPEPYSVRAFYRQLIETAQRPALRRTEPSDPRPQS